MPLRIPKYLDMETLLALAEYHDVDFSRAAEIVERSTRSRSAGVNAGVGGVGAKAGASRDLEVQRTYSLAPSDKAVVSRVIDALVADGHVLPLAPDTNQTRGAALEVEGVAHITTASTVGKLMYLFRDVVSRTETPGLLDLDALEEPWLARAVEVYLGGELVPAPVLLELVPTQHSSDLPKLYVNLEPGMFVTAAAQEQIEGAVTVLGLVDQLVGPGEYLSAEHWLLPGFDHLTRRLLMTSVDDVVQNIATGLDVGMPEGDVGAFFAGPAVLLKAIAVY